MQKDLFNNEKEPSQKSDVKPSTLFRKNEFEWNQFCRLGDMIGDGEHYEKGGKWIAREYKRLSKILIPELREQAKERRKLKSKNINEQMIKLLAEKKCKCGGNLEQSRSGSKICYCVICNARYKAGKKK